MTGLGPSPKGDRPFLDRLNLRTLKPERVWQCDDTSYETVVALLDDNATRIITRRETKTDPPNYFIARRRGQDVEARDDVRRSASAARGRARSSS